MKYLLVVGGFGRFTEFDKYARIFGSPEKAKTYVSGLHEEAWDEDAKDFKDGICWDEALLYQVNSDGTITLVNEYDTTARATTGEAIGWTK